LIGCQRQNGPTSQQKTPLYSPDHNPVFSLPVWLVLLLASPLIGSFTGLVVARHGSNRPILWGRSACDSCGRILSPSELVPLFSWVCLCGRCRHCNTKIGYIPLIIELAAVVAAAIPIALLPGSAVIDGVILGWIIIPIIAIDIDKNDASLLMEGTLLVSGLVSHHYGSAIAIFSAITIFTMTWLPTRNCELWVKYWHKLKTAALPAGIAAWIISPKMQVFTLFLAIVTVVACIGLAKLHWRTTLAISGWAAWLWMAALWPVK